jgi:hypothetical protein
MPTANEKKWPYITQLIRQAYPGDDLETRGLGRGTRRIEVEVPYATVVVDLAASRAWVEPSAISDGEALPHIAGIIRAVEVAEAIRTVLRMPLAMVPKEVQPLRVAREIQQQTLGSGAEQHEKASFWFWDEEEVAS